MFFSGAEWLFLLLHRVPMPRLGLSSFWQGTTGAAKYDEALDDAARRELLEETRITPYKVVPMDYSYQIAMQPEWRPNYPPGTEWIEEHVFTAILREQATPVLSQEHDKWAWLEYDAAVGMLKYPNNAEGLARCKKFMESNLNGL
jgi:8-oxo-dGTP pyrophosphatase MutT (NUDIX family)